MLPLKNQSAVSAADIVCNLCSVSFIVHKEDLDLLDIADKEFLEAVGHEMAGLQKQICSGFWGSELSSAPSCCSHNRSWAWGAGP